MCARVADLRAARGRSTQLLGIDMQFLLSLVVWLPLLLWCGFMMRRFGRKPGPPPGFVQGWSRKTRRFTYWGMLVCIIIAIVPTILLTGTLVGFDRCSAALSPADSWPCSGISRLGLLYGLCLIMVPAFLWLADFARRIGSDNPVHRDSD